MSLVATVLQIVIDGALGVWLGTIAFFSFVGAPRVFQVLEREKAGDVVNSIFPTYYLVGISLGVVTVTFGVVKGAVSGFRLPTVVVVVLATTGIVLNLYARQILIPRIKGSDRSRENPNEDAFEKYHKRSVVLNGVVLICVIGALVAAHF